MPIRVGLFVTCLANLFRPAVAFSSIRLLEEAGCTVEVPEAQTCCGQPAANSGDFAHARDLARQVIAAFYGYDYVVAPSGSCIGEIRHHYPELLAADPIWSAKAKDLGARAYELTSFLTDVLGKTEVKAKVAPCKATYHDSCSGLRSLNIREQPRRLLKAVEGISFTEMKDANVCCGFGGTFCVKYPDISAKIVSDKATNIANSGADIVVGGDLGCLLNMSGRLKRLGIPVKVYHVAEVLTGMQEAAALGEKEEEA